MSGAELIRRVGQTQVAIRVYRLGSVVPRGRVSPAAALDVMRTCGIAWVGHMMANGRIKSIRELDTRDVAPWQACWRNTSGSVLQVPIGYHERMRSSAAL